MKIYLIGFGLFFLGFILGFLFAAIFRLSSRADSEIERMAKDYEQREDQQDN